MPAVMSSDNTLSPTGSSAGPLLGLDGEPLRIGVLTSGGDAQGMNAAVRAVVRTAAASAARPGSPASPRSQGATASTAARVCAGSVFFAMTLILWPAY